MTDQTLKRKHALKFLNRLMRHEFGKPGKRLVMYAPGLFEKPMNMAEPRHGIADIFAQHYRKHNHYIFTRIYKPWLRKGYALNLDIIDKTTLRNAYLPWLQHRNDRLCHFIDDHDIDLFNPQNKTELVLANIFKFQVDLICIAAELTGATVDLEDGNDGQRKLYYLRKIHEETERSDTELRMIEEQINHDGSRQITRYQGRAP